MPTPLRLKFWQRASLCSAILIVSNVSVAATSDAQNPNQLEQSYMPISQLSDVSSSDWAFGALMNLMDRYGCIARPPNRNIQVINRDEFATGVNACSDKIDALFATGLGDKVLSEDLITLQNLQEKFAAETKTSRIKARPFPTGTDEQIMRISRTRIICWELSPSAMDRLRDRLRTLNNKTYRLESPITKFNGTFIIKFSSFSSSN